MPVIPVIPSTPTTSTGTQTGTTAALPPQKDLPSTLPVKGSDVAQSQAGNAAGSTNVPEPDSIALLLGGMGLMGLVLRRRPR
jgi:hypothetical protein